MYGLIVNVLGSVQIVNDPYNPGQMQVFSTVEDLRVYIAETGYKDYLVFLIDPIYRNLFTFNDLVKSKEFAAAFKREKVQKV
jgi:hypothetical protein